MADWLTDPAFLFGCVVGVLIALAFIWVESRKRKDD